MQGAEAELTAEAELERARKRGEVFCSTSVHMAELWRGGVEDK